MSFPFTDQPERDYLSEQDAGETREHLRLVRSAVVGGDEYADADVERMAKDFSDSTCAADFIVAHFAFTSEKFPDFSQRVGDYLMKLVGLTGGVDDYVEVTDEDIAAAMGCSTKTVQNARNELRTWPEYTKLVRIKDNYQTPEGESHPHAYHVLLTRHAAETALEARLSPGSDDFSRRREIFEGAGRITARSLKGFVAKPPKRRKRKTDAQLLVSELEQAARRIRSAAQRHGGDAEHEEIARLRGDIYAALAELDAAFGFGFHAETVSTLNTIQEEVETGASAFSDVPADSRRVEVPVEGAVESTQVEKLSTPNVRTESTVYENPSPPELTYVPDDDGPRADLAEHFSLHRGRWECRYPAGASPELLEAIGAEARRLSWEGVSDA